MRESPPGTFVVMRSDDLIAGLPIVRPNGISLAYAISQDGSHHLLRLKLRTDDPTNDDCLVVDGSPVARESDPTGVGDVWSSFSLVAINNDGDYLVSGNTDAPSSHNHVLAYNGAIAIREGQTLDGTALNAEGYVDALALNNAGGAVFLWKSPGRELLFHTCDASTLTSAKIIARTTDTLDFDGDGLADATLSDFLAASVLGNALAFPDIDRLYVAAGVSYGGPALDAMLGFDLPRCIFADGFESGTLDAWSNPP